MTARIFLLFWLLIFSLLLMVPSGASATFADDYQNYLNTYDIYRTAHTNFVAARNQYAQYQTLSSKNEALATMKNAMIARDDVLLSHFSLLSSKNAVQEYTGFIQQLTSSITLHKSQIPSLGSLEDGYAKSEELEELDVSMQSLSRKVVGQIVLTKVDNLKLRLVILENDASILINQLRDQNRDVSILERWLIETRNKRALAEQKLAEARQKIQALSATNNAQLNQNYTDFQSRLYEANQYLREATSFMTELSESIKYGNF